MKNKVKIKEMYACLSVGNYYICRDANHNLVGRVSKYFTEIEEEVSLTHSEFKDLFFLFELCKKEFK